MAFLKKFSGIQNSCFSSPEIRPPAYRRNLRPSLTKKTHAHWIPFFGHNLIDSCQRLTRLHRSRSRCPWGQSGLYGHLPKGPSSPSGKNRSIEGLTKRRVGVSKRAGVDIGGYRCPSSIWRGGALNIHWDEARVSPSELNAIRAEVWRQRLRTEDLGSNSEKRGSPTYRLRLAIHSAPAAVMRRSA